MKVYVYRNLDDMRSGCMHAMIIEGVTDITQNITGGWLVETERNGYVFPADIYMDIDKKEE